MGAYGWMGLAAALVCAQGAMAAARVEVSVGAVTVAAPATVTTGGWKVSVSVDEAACVIYCTYRKTGGVTLLPPVRRCGFSANGRRRNDCKFRSGRCGIGRGGGAFRGHSKRASFGSFRSRG